MTEHNYLTVKKTEELGSELSEVYTDIQIIRAFSEGFDNPKRLTKDEIIMSYYRAFQFFGLLHSKAQRLEEQLDDIAAILLTAGECDTLQEYLPLEEMNLPKIKG